MRQHRYTTLITAPTVEPLTLAEARLHLRLDSDDTEPNPLITALIVAARERAELETSRQLITATWSLVLPAFPCGVIELPRPPLVSVTGVTYVDLAGVTQTWSSSEYQFIAPSGPYCGRGLLAPRYGYTYPDTQPDTLAAVTVTFTAGYGANASSVPQSIKQAMLLLISDWYQHPEQVVVGDNAVAIPLPVGAAALLRPFRNDSTR
jgi:uncharacterized phiE125 gp8 family phage protein